MKMVAEDSLGNGKKWLPYLTSFEQSEKFFSVALKQFLKSCSWKQDESRCPVTVFLNFDNIF